MAGGLPKLTDQREGTAIDAVDGVFPVSDLKTYLLDAGKGCTTPEWPPYVEHLKGTDGRFATVCFENYVGQAEVGGLRFDVRGSKLTGEQFERMLQDVVEGSDALAFGFDAPVGRTATPDAAATDLVPYHALAYLRHVMRRLQGGESLLGQFLELSRNPHRKVRTAPSWIPAGEVGAVSAGALLAVASHPERLERLPQGHVLGGTSLAHRLHERSVRGEWLFPSALLDVRRHESFDTHENRLVKAFLSEAADTVASFAGRTLGNPELKADLVQMKGELEHMRSHGFLDEVGSLSVFPASSTTLQRRAGYKEFFGHWLALRTATALHDDALWHRLLDLKDCATLYELWCFFQVKAVLDEMLHNGGAVEIEVADTDANVPWSAHVTYAGGRVVLAYNRTFKGRREVEMRPVREDTSYSVELRPDITVHVRRSDTVREALVLDAKFKFDRQKLNKLADAKDGSADEPERSVRRAVRADLHKMHAYRDALHVAVGAFVLYPGAAHDEEGEGKAEVFREKLEGRPFEGVGAVPLTPGRSGTDLQNLVRTFLAG